MTQNQGHTIEEHAFQLRYFIKRIVDDDAWMTACRMLEDVLDYPTKEGVARIWEFVDAQKKGRSRDEVVKKPRIERKPRKARQPRHPRAPKVTAKRERAYPCPTCDTGECLPKPKGKGRWPICPACHKAGKNEPRVPASLAAPTVEDRASDLGKTVVESPEVATAAKIAAKRLIIGIDQFYAEERLRVAKDRFRREGLKPRHTGKTAHKRAAKKYREQVEA